MCENINQKYKEKLIETFKAFDKFCQKHNIKYYAAYGTAIGAIRHKGLIPWDDDIDVYMLRPDYEKFCSLQGHVNDKYDIMNINNDNYWLLELAKFVDTNTTLWEFEEFPLILGVYIDIFPLYEIDTEENAIMMKQEHDYYSTRIEEGMKHYSIKKILSSLKHPRYTYKCLLSKYYYRYKLHRNIKKYLSWIKKCSKIKGNYYISYEGGYGLGEMMNKEWFKESIKVPFEDTFINLPIGYDGILKGLYGEYMSFPPKEKQKSIHGRYFLDLSQRYTLSEVTKIIKNGPRV